MTTTQKNTNVRQKLIVGEVAFNYENGKVDMLVDNGTFSRLELDIEDLETIGDFFSRVISAYHAHEYRWKEGSV